MTNFCTPRLKQKLCLLRPLRSLEAILSYEIARRYRRSTSPPRSLRKKTAEVPGLRRDFNSLTKIMVQHVARAKENIALTC